MRSQRFITVNCGSSSLKLGLHSFNGETLTTVTTNSVSWDKLIKSSLSLELQVQDILKDFLDNSRDDTANKVEIIHRFVCGGEFCHPVVLSSEIISELKNLIPIAPLHIPKSLQLVESCSKILKTRTWAADTIQYAVFDTLYFASLPRLAQAYALPTEVTEKYKIRRFGYHGLAHSAMAKRFGQLQGSQANRLVTLQLGSGCSIAAIKNGDPVDTSMGFTPLEGLMMKSRTGDIDPGLLLYLLTDCNFTPESLSTVLTKHSGIDGVSGVVENVSWHLENGDEKSKFALDLFCYRAKKYLGAMAAVLGGIDGVVFSGGIGANLPEIRSQILSGLDFLGIHLEQSLNQSLLGDEGFIHAESHSVPVLVSDANEAREMIDLVLNITNTGIS